MCPTLQCSTSNGMSQHSTSARRQPTCGAWTSVRCPASCRFLAACHSHRMLVKDWLNRVQLHTKHWSSATRCSSGAHHMAGAAKLLGDQIAPASTVLSPALSTQALQQLAVQESDNQRSLKEQSVSRWAHPTTKESSSRACHTSQPEVSSAYPDCLATRWVPLYVACKAAQVKQQQQQGDQRTQRVSRSLPDCRLDLSASRPPWRHMSCVQSAALRAAR